MANLPKKTRSSLKIFKGIMEELNNTLPIYEYQLFGHNVMTIGFEKRSYVAIVRVCRLLDGAFFIDMRFDGSAREYGIAETRGDLIKRIREYRKEL